MEDWLAGPASPTVGVLSAFLILTLLLLAGMLLQQAMPRLKHVHVPAALLGGALALMAGPQILGAMMRAIPGMPAWTYYGLIPPWLGEIWGDLPEPMVALVFAGLLLGRTLPPLKTMIHRAGPQLVMGYGFAWGHYVIGTLLALYVLTPVFGINPLSSALIAIGFQGGYGAAIGLDQMYQALDFPEGKDLAVGMATIGKVLGLIIGPLLLNYAIEDRARVFVLHEKEEDTRKAVLLYRNTRRQRSMVANVLGLQIAKLAVAIAIGWVIYRIFLGMERLILPAGSQVRIIEYLPLFPFAMVGGLILQIFLQRKNRTRMLDRRILEDITGTALDFVIISAIATLHLDILIRFLPMLLLLTAGAMLITGIIFLVMAPRIYHREPWVYGTTDMAHSVGTAITGLVMIRVADPENDSGAKSSFNLKQPLYEIFMGGGIITAIFMPLVFNFGVEKMLYVSTLILSLILLTGIVVYGFRKQTPLSEKSKVHPHAALQHEEKP